MADNTPDDKPKESKINQNLLIAIIGAVATIAATVIGAVLNRPQPSAPPPVVITVTSAPVTPTDIIFLTNTPVPLPTETVAPTFTPTLALPTATATEQVGVFNEFLANEIKGTSTTQFKPDPTIYLLFDLNDPTGLNVVTIRWSVVKVTSYKPDAEITRSTHKITNNHFGLGFKPILKLPGKYKVEIFLNNNIVPDKTIEFDIVP